jgi:hypothetical protein
MVHDKETPTLLDVYKKCYGATSVADLLVCVARWNPGTQH